MDSSNYAAQVVDPRYYGIGVPAATLSVTGLKEREVGVIEGATNTINEAAQRVGAIIAQVQALADATFGGQPGVAGIGGRDAQNVPPSMGRAENLQRAGSSLHAALSALESEVNRLRGL